MRARVAAALLALLALLAGACAQEGRDGGVERADPPGSTSTTAAGPGATAAPVAEPAPSSPASPAAAPVPPRPAGAPPACPAIPARAEPRRDRPQYVLRVDVKLADNAVDGDLTVRFRPDLPTDKLVFRLWPNGPRPSRAGARLDVGQVSLGAHPATTSRPNATTLVVDLGRHVPAGTPLEVSMPWRLTLPGPSDDRLSRSGDAVRLGSFFPVLAWEPGTGWAEDPATSAFAESSTAPTADFTVSVAVPDGLQVLATGVPDGAGRWRAEHVRDVAISVGRFRLVAGAAGAGRPSPVAVTVGVHEGIGDSPNTYLDKVVRSLDDFARRYGPYPWPAYSLAITPNLRGGIEYPMHVMQGPGTGGRTTSHEVAHMWFYGLVGNNQGRDPVLDEGVATFAEGRFEGTLGSMRSQSIPSAGRGRAGEPMTYWEPRQSIYYRSVYVQGAQALAALGDAELVDCALRLYAARTAHGIARPADLVAAAEAVFPDARAVLARYGIRP